MSDPAPHRNLRLVSYTALVLGAFALGVAWQNGRASVGWMGWLKGSSNQKFETVANHLRGLDLTMMEVGYRHRELAWAGDNKEWVYAKYQVEKLEKALNFALERRPNRASHVPDFKAQGLQPMLAAIEKQDPVVFAQGFRSLTLACINCHSLEQAPFLRVDLRLDERHRLEALSAPAATKP
jgi:hypothetical protein